MDRIHPPRTSLKAYQLSSAKLTVGRLLWSDPVKKLLAQMDYHQLFYVADKAPRIAVNNVSRFMKENVDDVLAEEMKGPILKTYRSIVFAMQAGGGNENILLRLDRPILIRILSYLLLPDRICFGQTSRIRKYLTALVLQSEVTKILAPYGINYGEMKLLQAATGAIISGSTISALVHEPFVPNDLDLYCHYPAATRVVHFIEEMAGFDHAGYRSLEYIDITGIKGVWTLLGPGGSKINVVETLASNPIKCIASSFHSSPPRGALKWDGLVHFEANQVVRSQALITPASMHLDDPCDFDQQVTSWHILHKYKARGFKYVFEYDEQHECGRHVSCPVTVRSTVDAGCLQAMLPLIRSIPCFTTVVHKPVTWSLRGSACAAGIVSGSLGLHPATGFQDKVFRTLIVELLSRDEPPTYPGAISIWGRSEDADTEGVVEYAPGMGPGSDYERSGSETESEAESEAESD